MKINTSYSSKQKAAFLYQKISILAIINYVIIFDYFLNEAIFPELLNFSGCVFSEKTIVVCLPSFIVWQKKQEFGGIFICRNRS
jgi:hypothetical protein